MGGRGIDLSSLTRSERLVLAAAVLGYANGFIPWWYRAATAAGTVRFNAGLTTWGVLSVVLFGLVAIAVLGRAAIWPSPAPRADGLLYVGLGAAIVAGLMLDAAEWAAEWLGLYAGLGLAVVVVVAGGMRVRDRRAGWV